MILLHTVVMEKFGKQGFARALVSGSWTTCAPAVGA